MRLNYGILICLWISCWVRHVLTLAIPHPIDLLSRIWCPEEEVIPEVFQVSRRVTPSQLFLWRWSSAMTFWSPLCFALMCLCKTFVSAFIVSFCFHLNTVYCYSLMKSVVCVNYVHGHTYGLHLVVFLKLDVTISKWSRGYSSPRCTWTGGSLG